MEDEAVLSENNSKNLDWSKKFIFMEKCPIHCRLSCQLWYLVGLCTIVLIFVLAVHPPPSFSNLKEVLSAPTSIDKKNDNLPKIVESLRLVRQCVIRASQKHEGEIWQRLHIMITTCAVNYAQRLLSYMHLRTDKSFLPFQKGPDEMPMTDFCNEVTLGIGNEITYETILKRFYPFCQFYGADPYPETGDAFKPLGRVFYTAIDNVTKDQQFLNVLRHGSYDWRDGVKVTSVGDFLKKMAQIQFVHFLSMDIEGAEYRVMPYLIDEAFVTESDNATICQISAEFHGPLSYYNITVNEFESLWINLITNSPYVPLRALSPGNHHRFHLFNMENEQCLRSFLVTKF